MNNMLQQLNKQKMKKITKRDVLVFILGFMTFFIIDIITDWQSAKKALIKGSNSIETKKQNINFIVL